MDGPGRARPARSATYGPSFASGDPAGAFASFAQVPSTKFAHGKPENHAHVNAHADAARGGVNIATGGGVVRVAAGGRFRLPGGGEAGGARVRRAPAVLIRVRRARGVLGERREAAADDAWRLHDSLCGGTRWWTFADYAKAAALVGGC